MKEKYADLSKSNVKPITKKELRESINYYSYDAIKRMKTIIDLLAYVNLHTFFDQELENKCYELKKYLKKLKKTVVKNG